VTDSQGTHELNTSEAAPSAGAGGVGPAVDAAAGGTSATDATGQVEQSGLARWMAESPWHPRITPELLYLLLLLVTMSLEDQHPALYGTSYVLQCGLVVWLLWRFRHLLPEMNWKFHWLAIPVGVGVFAAWIGLGEAMRLIPGWFDDPGRNFFTAYETPAAAWTLLILRLLGMSIVVPMFEELFNRSLLLRAFHRPRQTGIAIVQVISDLPGIGDLLMNTRLARRASQYDHLLSKEFQRVPLGQLSVFGVAMSTFVFMLAHGVRDWPACIVCGVAYCLLVGATNRKGREMGLGPVIWAHGITNALLWAWVLYADAWHFL